MPFFHRLFSEVALEDMGTFDAVARTIDDRLTVESVTWEADVPTGVLSFDGTKCGVIEIFDPERGGDVFRDELDGFIAEATNLGDAGAPALSKLRSCSSLAIAEIYVLGPDGERNEDVFEELFGKFLADNKAMVQVDRVGFVLRGDRRDEYIIIDNP